MRKTHHYTETDCVELWILVEVRCVMRPEFVTATSELMHELDCDETDVHPLQCVEPALPELQCFVRLAIADANRPTIIFFSGRPFPKHFDSRFESNSLIKA